MPRFSTFTVAREIDGRPGLQRVELNDGSHAYTLTELTGPVAVGDEVVVNTTAVDLHLGTGGSHVIHWNLSRRTWQSDGGGHVMKLRYTSLQTDTGIAAEGGLPTETLPETPVVAITLHSQLAAVAAGVAAREPAQRVAFVMTPGGALPLALSDLVACLRAEDLLAGTVTAGHAFGGDVEAADVADALVLAVSALRADVIVAGPGPGLAGTGTRLGTTALDAVATLDLAAALGGRPVLCVRASASDERPRHRGISHHTRTVAALLRSPVDVAVPPDLAGDASAMNGSRPPDLAPHQVVPADPTGATALLRARHIEVTTMGRDALTDELFVPAAAAAGAHAATLAAEQTRR